MNNRIVYGDIRKFEKENQLSMPIPMEIYESVVCFCGDEEIIIPVPRLSIESVEYDKITIKIENVNREFCMVGFQETPGFQETSFKCFNQAGRKMSLRIVIQDLKERLNDRQITSYQWIPINSI